MKTRRISAGRYQTLDGRFELRSIAVHSDGMSTATGWHLFDLHAQAEGSDGYCNTFYSKWEALDLLTRAREAGTY